MQGDRQINEHADGEVIAHGFGDAILGDGGDRPFRGRIFIRFSILVRDAAAGSIGTPIGGGVNALLAFAAEELGGILLECDPIELRLRCRVPNEECRIGGGQGNKQNGRQGTQRVVFHIPERGTDGCFEGAHDDTSLYFSGGDAAVTDVDDPVRPAGKSWFMGDQ